MIAMQHIDDTTLNIHAVVDNKKLASSCCTLCVTLVWVTADYYKSCTPLSSDVVSAQERCCLEPSPGRQERQQTLRV